MAPSCHTPGPHANNPDCPPRGRGPSRAGAAPAAPRHWGWPRGPHRDEDRPPFRGGRPHPVASCPQKHSLLRTRAREGDGGGYGGRKRDTRPLSGLSIPATSAPHAEACRGTRRNTRPDASGSILRAFQGLALTPVPPGSLRPSESILRRLSKMNSSNCSLLYISTVTGQDGPHA